MSEHYLDKEAETERLLGGIDDKTNLKVFEVPLPKHSSLSGLIHVPEFVPSWEGLRGIAVLMTCICHISKYTDRFNHFSGAGGVAIFLVLSGFLITGVLLKLQEKLNDQSSRYGHLKKFYIARSIRLYPALIGMVLTTGIFYIIYRFNGNIPPNFWYHTIYTLFYISDLHQPSLYAKPKTIWFNTWSLSVEEQFYIFWSLALPILMSLKPRRRITVILLLCLSSFSLHIASGISSENIWLLSYTNPFRNVWKLLFGALLRLSPVSSWFLEPLMAWVGLSILGTVYLASLSAIPLDLTSLGFGRIFGHLVYHEILAVLATTLIILGTTKGGNKFLESQFLRFIGRVSYSLYLYQDPLLLITRNRRGYFGVSSTAFAFVIASISTIYYEEPIRNWYRSYTDHTRKKDDIENMPHCVPRS